MKKKKYKIVKQLLYIINLKTMYKNFLVFLDGRFKSYKSIGIACPVLQLLSKLLIFSNFNPPLPNLISLIYSKINWHEYLWPSITLLITSSVVILVMALCRTVDFVPGSNLACETDGVVWGGSWYEVTPRLSSVISEGFSHKLFDNLEHYLDWGGQ